MSRIGKKVIDVESGVNVAVSGRRVTVKGPKGELSIDLPEGITVEADDKQVNVGRNNEERETRGLHGLTRSLIANMIEGVSKGFTRRLEIEGVGFKAQLEGRKMLLSLGFASPKEYHLPDGVEVSVDGGTKIEISGADKQKVGYAASRIRSFYPAEPYKGKGIKYENERIRRKVGKTVA